jgi:hypothetical protein
MRKLSLTVIGMYLGILSAFSQETTGDSSLYQQRKLKLEEVNFVSGYYKQDGNHSAVTGGVGTEHLTDFANTIDLKFFKYDNKLRKHSLTFELGIDHYSSASSDKIDPHTISSASSADTRFYPSLAWSRQNQQTGNTLGANISFSKEFDYTSFGFGVNWAKASKDNNREFSAKLQAYLDQWKVILPIELRNTSGGRDDDYPSESRNSFSGSFALSQIVNKNFQVQLIAEPTYQTGLLATKYQRVYFTNGEVQSEVLPDNRFKIPLGIRANYFLGDRFIIRSFYRYYQDDWGLKAHTVDLEVPIKITAFFSFSPFYRYYTQEAIDYFAPYQQHSPGETYFTSDYDLSHFNSQFYGAGFRVVPEKGVFGLHNWNSLELRYGHYTRNDGLNANQVSLHLKFK